MNGRYNRFSCPYQGCEKNYSSSKMCKHHISSIHHNEQIRCPIQSCGKVYKYPETIRKHIRKKHKDEWPPKTPSSPSLYLKPIKVDNDKYQCPIL
ncbi:hypothetical protein DERF_012006 [Dermatophagoides farinae]|uniref:C2H2-type domain-containing protein n=1 Tax=Dermatophagoides farinae TaxID=6954 RepID=A0A922L1B0_DERFA|nr:hypothetical protein DERF_012006 [Dermatophagoides farinae]